MTYNYYLCVNILLQVDSLKRSLRNNTQVLENFQFRRNLKMKTILPMIFTYDIESFTYDIESFTYDIESFVYDIESFVYDIESYAYDIESYAYDIESF